MTTHYQNIQALGNRMASNLETMGVSASFNDGGLTLADKILQIQHFTNGLLLSADKSVEQSGNTVKLTALLMKNGETVSGATVLLFTDWINQTYSSNTTINQSIGNEWTIDVGNTADIWICANGSTIAGGSAILAISKGVLIVYKNGDHQVVRSHSSSVYSYKDGVVYYGNSSVDISSYGVDVTNLYKTSDVGGAVKVTYGVSLTTDSNGVASYSYTCAGRGKKTFTAKSGSVVSNSYEVIDAMYFEEGTTDKSSNWTLNNISYSSSSGEYIALSNSYGSTRWAILKINNGTSYFDSSNDYCVEVDIKNSNSSVLQLVMYNTSINIVSYVNTSDFTTIKLYSSRSENKVYYVIDGTTRSVDINTTQNNDFRFRVGNNEGYCFKNLKVYPI